MSEPETQFFFEPVEYLIESKIEEREDYFFNKVIKEDKDHFEVINIASKLRSKVEESIDTINNELKEKLGRIISSHTMIEKLALSSEGLSYQHPIRYRRIPTQYYFHKESDSIIWRFDANTFYIISKSREEGERLIGFIKSAFEKLGAITADFGLKFTGFFTGSEYQKRLLERLENVENITVKESKNALEREIINFCSNFTSSFLPNVDIAFTEPNETFEYDVFIGFNERKKLIIEVKDYESVKEQISSGESLKSKIILGTYDKARRIRAEVIVIVGGFPEQTFRELEKIAVSRNVKLFNDRTYEKELPMIFWNNLLAAYSVTPPYRMFETIRDLIERIE